jgi:hypothetical protein
MADTTIATVSTPPLPSQSSASALLAGDIGALPMVGLHLLGRAALIGAGIALLTGERDGARLVKSSLAGAAMIELFVFIHELTNRPSQQATKP